MKDFVADLFFHFFIMMMIPLISIVINKNSIERKTNYLLLFALLIPLVLTIVYPVQIADGIEFDLKFIPVFIAFFYIGPLAGGIVIGAILGLNALSELSHLPILFINYLIMIPLFGFFYRYYLNGKLIHKLSIGITFYLFITVTRMIELLQTGHNNDLLHLLLFSVVSVLTLFIIIYLIEMNRLQLLLREQLQNADKLNAVSQLAASVAHEIRNPMTTIRGFLQILKEEENLSEKQETFISISLEEIDRTQNIIGDFLSLARPNNNDCAMIHLTKTIEEVKNFMQAYAAICNVHIFTEIEKELFIKGNINECKQLFINLIKNGIEAMPTGGTIEIYSYKTDHNVIIEINDNGVGLSPHQLKKLGQPYYSTKTKGTGLGLMICFDIIKRMNGEYQISSEENIGTSFKMHFPL
ncbi:two-component system sporulation sensor kinase B [Cytobacillus eiseniae]|uniref:histidine kinase n=1 Tax=Cytobacillus eiseniae TaxID=762947 RepID=A0ABS4RCY6_9BACI|nr:ATP-binding protein [Cytobacillus eiseniae]MBP2239717.1 two-component system sporulation sensor kinase B [Cytobacillus eiseniae]